MDPDVIDPNGPPRPRPKPTTRSTTASYRRRPVYERRQTAAPSPSPAPEQSIQQSPVQKEVQQTTQKPLQNLSEEDFLIELRKPRRQKRPKKPKEPKKKKEKTTKEKGHKSVKKLLLSALVCLFILGVCGGTFWGVKRYTSSQNTPQKVSYSLIEDIKTRDSEAAYSMTSQGFRDATSKEQLTSVINQISPYYQETPIISDQKLDNAVDPKAAVVVFKVSANSGAEYYLRVVLEKKDGKWKIYNFQSKDQPLPTDLTIE